MAVTFIDTNLGYAGDTENFSFSLPGGITDGQLVLLMASGHKAFAGDPGPSSWTLLAQDDGTKAVQWKVWWRIWHTGDSTTVNIAMNASTEDSYAIVATFSGVSLASPIGGSSDITGGSATSLSLSGITPQANSMLVEILMHYNNVNGSAYAITTDNPTWTEQQQLPYLSFATASRSQATATGNATATLSAEPESYGFVLLSLNQGASSPSSSPSTSVSNSPSTSPSSSVSNSPSTSPSSSVSNSPSSSPSSSISNSPSPSPSPPTWDFQDESGAPLWTYKIETLG
jgi:hypothetical protein